MSLQSRRKQEAFLLLQSRKQFVASKQKVVLLPQSMKLFFFFRCKTGSSFVSAKKEVALSLQSRRWFCRCKAGGKLQSRIFLFLFFVTAKQEVALSLKSRRRFCRCKAGGSFVTVKQEAGCKAGRVFFLLVVTAK